MKYRPVAPYYVIEIDAVNGPCWVATGGGDPERTHDIFCAEVYPTEAEALEKANALHLKYPGRKITVCRKDL